MAANVESMFYTRKKTVAWTWCTGTGSAGIKGCVKTGRIGLESLSERSIYRLWY